MHIHTILSLFTNRAAQAPARVFVLTYMLRVTNADSKKKKKKKKKSVLYSENAARQIPKPPMTFEISGEGLRCTDVMATESRASSVHGKRWNPADAKTKKRDMTVDTQRTST
jgi:hypothetical protein